MHLKRKTRSVKAEEIVGANFAFHVLPKRKEEAKVKRLENKQEHCHVLQRRAEMMA